MHNSDSRSGMFLLEMILVILFFSLTAAVYARLFAVAYRTGEDSRNLTQAVMISQNLAEAFLANGGDSDDMRALFPVAEITDDQIILYYYEDWVEMAAERKHHASFSARLRLYEDTPLRNADVLVSDKDGKKIYQLDLTRYTPGEQEE